MSLFYNSANSSLQQAWGVARSEGGECYSIGDNGCREITVLVDLICTYLVSGVFCTTSGFAMLITNNCVAFSTACAAAIF